MGGAGPGSPLVAPVKFASRRVARGSVCAGGAIRTETRQDTRASRVCTLGDLICDWPRSIRAVPSGRVEARVAGDCDLHQEVKYSWRSWARVVVASDGLCLFVSGVEFRSPAGPRAWLACEAVESAGADRYSKRWDAFGSASVGMKGPS